MERVPEKTLLRLFLILLSFGFAVFSNCCVSARGDAKPEITGQILDASTKEPQAGIEVGIVSWEVFKYSPGREPIYPQKKTRTDNDGKFSFYLTGALKRAKALVVFTSDEVYQNQVYKNATFRGKYPTRNEVQDRVEPVNYADQKPLTFLLEKAVRIEDPVFIPMRDGVKLCALMYMPKEEGRFPVILLRTPYGRETLREYASVAREGYVIVCQDLRGRGDSEGENVAFVNDAWGELQDGYDTVEWLAKQPFCNGIVATAGGSALGIVQELLAGTAPPHLRAQVIAVAVPDLYRFAVYPGGVYREEQVSTWLKKHKFDPKTLKLMQAHPLYDEFWAGLDLTNRIEKVNVPTLLIGGWYDSFAEGTIYSYKLRTMRAGSVARENTFLVMGPWGHDALFSQYVGEIRFPDEAGRSFFGEVLSFLNFYLKGMRNIFPDEVPKVQYYVMGDLSDPQAPGNFWMSSDDFPPEAKIARFYLTKSGELTPDKPLDADAESSFPFNPTEPVPTRGGRNLNIPQGPQDQRPIEERDDVIYFTSETLTKPLPVVGFVSGRFFVATTGFDADVSVRLTDVYPDGTSFLVLDSTSRLSTPEPFTERRKVVPGRFYETEVPLGHTAYIFNAGHRIRIAIAGSNYPRYEVNKLASPDNKPIKITLSLSKDMPAYVELPVYEGVIAEFNRIRGG